MVPPAEALESQNDGELRPGAAQDVFQVDRLLEWPQSPWQWLKQAWSADDCQLMEGENHKTA
jgi:hypothetical protein